MFFQISPAKRAPKKPKPVKNEAESEEIAVLSLAPFTPNPKLFFENIKVGSTATRKLLINNPTNRDINLFVNKNLPEDVSVEFSWEQRIIEQYGQTQLELLWSPENECALRFAFSLVDYGKIKRDIPVALKSISASISAKPKKTGAKPKPKTTYVAKKVRSPVKIASPLKRTSSLKRSSPLKRTSPLRNSPQRRYEQNRSPAQNKKSKIYSPSSKRSVLVDSTNKVTEPTAIRRGTFVLRDKENFISPNVALNDSLFLSPSNIQFTPGVQSQERRLTYAVKGDLNKSDDFDDSLEMTDSISPTVSKFSLNPLVELDVRFSKYNSKMNPLEAKLASESFRFTPVNTPIKPRSMFEERIDQLQLTENITFNFTSPQEEKHFGNISSETYNCKNTSTETCSKDNRSFETYVKGNLSAGTYVKDTSIGDIANLSMSPVNNKNLTQMSPTFKHPKPLSECNLSRLQSLNGENVKQTVEANLWSSSKRPPLVSITEESFRSDSESGSPIRQGIKRKANIRLGYSPSKKLNLMGLEPRKVQTWSKKGGVAARIATSTSGLNINHTDKSYTLTETKTLIVTNPYLLAATNMIDPFMSSNLYCDAEWMEKQEQDFRKWLNALLTPPTDLETDNNVKIDVTKLWKESRNRDVAPAPSREVLSNQYHTSNKLNSLRYSAANLFRSKEMCSVLSKVMTAVEAGKLQIREDKDVHLNIAIKSELMSLLLSFNPLWLRIALETIYNEIIPLNSNSDIIGLSNFLKERLFKDPYLIKKHKTMHTPKYGAEFKKFFLKKFLVLVYFLDQAKSKKIIAHDPCLFNKNAFVKETREVLLRLAKETLFAVGDITKYLKLTGYVVTHKQTYIQEFDYAVNNLGVDLRDGVRLTKVMEIILIKEDLTLGLRVPAISRLQKVHNMKIVFESLEEAGFKILYEITPKDIVDGHKEKTLSFLWQIIYKFEAPLMVRSSTKIQTWFRSLPVILKRRKLNRIWSQKQNAAKTIQLWYRRQVLSEKLYFYAVMLRHYLDEQKRNRAVLQIQSYYRMYVVRKRYKMQYNAILKLQAVCKGWLTRNFYQVRIISAIKIQCNVKMFLQRKKYLRLKQVTLCIQERYRANKLMYKEHKAYFQLKQTVSFVQARFRANVLTKKHKNEFIQLRTAAVTIQKRYRAKLMMEKERENYLALKIATAWVQDKYRANKLMQKDRDEYIKLKQTVIFFQARYRANVLAKKHRNKFIELKNAAITIQNRYRAKKSMETERINYLKLKDSSIKVQSWYRSILSMRVERSRYITMKKSVFIFEERYLAQKHMKIQRNNYQLLKKCTITTQTRFRATKAMQIAKTQYLELKNASIKIQQWYRSIVSMRTERSRYIALKTSVRVFEERYLAYKICKTEREKYNTLKTATVKIQTWYRSTVMMKKERSYYVQLKKAVKITEIRYSAKKLSEKTKNEYIQTKMATVLIQQKYRAYKSMQIARTEYTKLKTATVVIQNRFRANKLCKIGRENYLQLRKSTIEVQRRFRAQQLMKEAHNEYNQLKNSTVKIQIWYRSILEMRTCRRNYLQLQKSVRIVEKRYIAQKEMIKTKQYYNKLKNAVVLVQTIFRANQEMKVCRSKYISILNSVKIIQKRYRAKKLMIIKRKQYVTLKKSAVVIQQRYRAQIAMKKVIKFKKIRNAAVVIQSRYRANRAMLKARSNFTNLRQCVVNVQNRFRANQKMKQALKEYQALKKATIVLQLRYRAIVAMRKQQSEYNKLKTAAIVIQRRYMAQTLMQQQRNDYRSLKNAASVLQARFRVKLEMNLQRNNFVNLKQATITIQQRFRAYKLTKLGSENYQLLKKSTVIIQQRFRAQILMKTQKKAYETLRSSTVIIQRRLRAYLSMKEEKSKYITLRNATLTLQSRYRAQIEMKKQVNTFQTLKSAAVTIQQHFKAQILMNIERNAYIVQKSSTLILQRRYRAMISMREERLKYSTLRNAVCCLQARYRAQKAMLTERNRFIALKTAAVTMQKNLRMKKAKNDYFRLRVNVIIIQRRFRANILRKEAVHEYQQLKLNVIFIQRLFRANQAMKQDFGAFEKAKNCAVKIQRWFRSQFEMRKCKEAFLRLRKATLVIQRFYFAYKAAKLEREMYQKKRKSIIVIQSAVRGFLVRSQYADWFTPEARERRALEKKQTEAAIKIQALWRGHRARRTEKKELVAIRLRSKIANANAVPQKTLKYRFDQAFELLITQHSALIQVVKALEDLNFVTRRCKTTCTKLAQFIPEQLYLMISSTARSLPEMQCCTLVLLILINICKYQKTTEYSFVPDCMDNLFKVMLNWCDKEAPVFTTMCTLLWLFAHRPEWKKVILDVPQLDQRLKKIYTLTMRKQGMVERTGVKGVSYFGPQKNLYMPSLKPDWGLDYKDKPLTFSHSVHALKSLLRILDL